MKRFVASLLWLAVLASSSRLAAEPWLVPGLAYVRPTPEAAFSAPEPASAVVVDLRGFSAEMTAAAGRPLRDFLEGSGPRPLRLILVDATTPSDLLRALEPRSKGVLVVGPKESQASLDIEVNADPEAMKRAAEALKGGKSPSALLRPKVEKPRYDEAAIVREHSAVASPMENPPVADDAPPPSPDTVETLPPEPQPSPSPGRAPSPAAPAEAAAANAAPPSAPLVDEVLQRAVDVYHALRALQRI